MNQTSEIIAMQTDKNRTGKVHLTMNKLKQFIKTDNERHRKDTTKETSPNHSDPDYRQVWLQRLYFGAKRSDCYSTSR